MLRYIGRRFVLALGTLLVLSFLVYAMLALALDPLEDLRASTAPNKPQLIARRIAMLELDKPWPVRYWHWLSHFVQGNLGSAWKTQQKVSDLLGNAIATSVSLIIFATIIALLLGVTIGVVSALRQYTGFDYSITFISFVLYSLPIFWVAVLLKQYLAIGINDYLNAPSLNWLYAIAFCLVAGLFWMGAIGGNARRRVIVFVVSAAVTLAVLSFLVFSNWLNAPRIGYPGLIVIGLASAFVVTLMLAGVGNKRALYSAFTTAVVGVILYVPLMYFFKAVTMSWGLAILMLLVAIGVGCLIGWLFGGPDKAISMRGASIVAVIMGVLIFADRVMQVYPEYFSSGVIKGRPIATIGSMTPNLGGDFWVQTLDRFTHVLLPTIALVLISFASYTRYERGAMLEVLQQDYIRTARAKGLTERLVIVRHALRNALMPLASVVPIDFISVIGGAVITETIFGWRGMGKLFIDSLRQNEADPVMAYVMITGALAIVANLLADFIYGLIDPRIRVNA